MNGLIAGLSSALIAVLTPILLISPEENMRDEPLIFIIESASKQERTIRLNTGAEVITIPMEEYLTGVMLSEMPMSFHPEALKAQAVAARTFAFRCCQKGKHSDCDLCADSTCCQAWSSKEAITAKLGEDYWDTAKEAVDATKGEILTYDGQIINAVYFSCSGGATESACAVWGSEVPYLQSVESGGEENAPRYFTQTAVETEAFKGKIKTASPNARLDGLPASWFGEAVYGDGGGVVTMEIGGTPFSGTELRKLFSLNSAKFTVSIEKNQIVFDVYGFGHRVGMSQYGADAMARAGSTYEEILSHYYTGTAIERIKE